MESWIVTAIWVIAPLVVASALVVYAALVLGSRCDDMQDELRAREEERAALGRAVQAVRDAE